MSNCIRRNFSTEPEDVKWLETLRPRLRIQGKPSQSRLRLRPPDEIRQKTPQLLPPAAKKVADERRVGGIILPRTEGFARG